MKRPDPTDPPEPMDSDPRSEFTVSFRITKTEKDALDAILASRRLQVKNLRLDASNISTTSFFRGLLQEEIQRFANETKDSLQPKAESPKKRTGARSR